MLSFSTRRARIPALTLTALCLLAPARAQDAGAPRPQSQEQDEVVRVSTDLVQTDVMVFDKQGKFVDGLKPEQFELRVDGRAQAIAFFERVEAGTVDEDAQLAAARGGARPATRTGGAVVPLDRGRTVIFFVDDLHLSASSATRTRQALLRFIEEELRQNDEAAVTSASGQVGFLQQFTDNRAVLRAAVERIKSRPYNVRDSDNPPMTEAHALAVQRRDDQVVSYFVDAILREIPRMPRDAAENMVSSRASNIIRQSEHIIGNTLYSLQDVVRNSAPLPGRKLLFFISDGFIFDPAEGSVRERMRRITDAAARAGVVIYSMDAQGLRSGMPEAGAAVAFDPTGRLSQTDSSELRDMQEALHTLAADTGGRALVNTNAMTSVVKVALKETARYYLLAWRPGEAGERREAKFQRIEVSVKGRPDLTVNVRRGFYNAPPAEPPKREESKKNKAEEAARAAATATPAPEGERELRAALGSTHELVSLPTALSLGYVNSPVEGGVLTASVGLRREALGLFAEQGEERARVDLLGAILDDRGQFVSGFKHGLLFDPRAQRSAREQVMYSYQFKLAPGLYQVRVAARDSRSGRTGSAMQWVEIPDFAKGQFALSSVFLGERTTATPTESLTAEKVSEGVLLNVERRFARTSRLRFVTHVYNARRAAAAPPDVALQVQVFRDDQPVFTAPLIKLRTETSADPSRIPYAAELALSTFPAGSYVLQLTAIDRAAKLSHTQRVSFFVE